MTIDKIISIVQENIIAFVSLFVALVTLWLAHLRGPVIKRLGKPLIVWKEIEKGKAEHTLYRLDLGGTFIFFNSGNRAGLVQNVRAEWEPNEKYMEFFDFRPFSTGYGTNTERLLHPPTKHLIIREKSVDRITMGEYIFVNNIIFKTLEHEHDRNIDIEHDDLKILIEESFAYKKRKLDELITLIESKNPGNLKISFECTGKKLFIWDTLKSESLSVEISKLPQETIAMYKDLQRKWETEKPATTRVMNKLSKTVEQYYDILNETKKGRDGTLESVIKNGGLRLFENYELPNKDWEYHILKRWTEYKDVINKTDEIYTKIAKCNELVKECRNGYIQQEKVEDLWKNVFDEIDGVLPELENAKEYFKDYI